MTFLPLPCVFVQHESQTTATQVAAAVAAEARKMVVVESTCKERVDVLQADITKLNLELEAVS
jgi:hypothetical protein